MQQEPFSQGIVGPGLTVDFDTGDWHFWGYPHRLELANEEKPGDYSTIFKLARRGQAANPPFESIDAPHAYRNGDSNYSISPGKREFFVGLSGKTFSLLARHNDSDRLGSIEILPFESADIATAQNTSRSIFDLLSAWLGVYYHVCLEAAAYITFRVDQMEKVVVFPNPYPVISIDDFIIKPYPVLFPFASLYAEGVKSNSVFYSFLCFFPRWPPQLLPAGATVNFTTRSRAFFVS
jgi:hypothetical protein